MPTRPSTQVEQSPVTRSRRAGYSIVDADVHPYTRARFESIYPYMTEDWRQRFRNKGTRWMDGTGFLSSRFAHPTGTALRADARADDGGPPASDPAFTAHDLLDRWGIDAAILHPFEPGTQTASLTTPEESLVAASAFNEYFAAEWLPVDPRYLLVMHVSAQDPVESAKEIRRFGKNPRVVAVAFGPINILLGNRHFYPIYEAAQEYELPIYYHVAGTQYIWQGTPVPAGGFPESHIEWRGTHHHIAEAAVNSLLWTGTFERFPRLKFGMIEWGFIWALAFVWRSESLWKNLRSDVPWVKKRPTEYIHEHIRFSTQPLDDPDGDQLERVIQMLGSDVLMFSTDYPHYDGDNPHRVLQGLPEAARRQIFVDNALDFFRISQ